MAKWDLYSQQPILLRHPSVPDSPGIFVAGVTKTKKYIIWWSASYMIGASMTGQGGSGFAEHPIPGKPKYVKDEDCWVLDDKNDGLYKFCLPSRDMLYQFEEFKNHLPSLEKMQAYTQKWEKIWG